MNYKAIAYAAMMTALIGGLFGWALSYMGRPDLERLRFESKFYRTLNQRLPLIGAGLGFATGAGFAVVSQAQKRRDQNNNSRF
jgi:hypothetical protein